jgi:hypothetical protein
MGYRDITKSCGWKNEAKRRILTASSKPIIPGDGVRNTERIRHGNDGASPLNGSALIMHVLKERKFKDGILVEEGAA